MTGTHIDWFRVHYSGYIPLIWLNNAYINDQKVFCWQSDAINLSGIINVNHVQYEFLEIFTYYRVSGRHPWFIVEIGRYVKKKSGTYYPYNYRMPVIVLDKQMCCGIIWMFNRIVSIFVNLQCLKEVIRDKKKQVAVMSRKFNIINIYIF